MSCKVIILAGGFGTRLREETVFKPKPMIEIGGKPILWHIMKLYSYYEFNDFILCLGYKGEIIKDYFLKYHYLNNDFTISIRDNKIELSDFENHENWNVTLADTGLRTQTGGRLKRVKKYIGDKTFMATYGDGVADINLKNLLKFHKKHGKIATITAVRPPSRFGELIIDEQNSVVEFSEKPLVSLGWINGGFFVFEPEVFDYIKGDQTYFEREPLENLAKDGELMSYLHSGYWRGIDTLREVTALNDEWNGGMAGWKVW